MTETENSTNRMYNMFNDMSESSLNDEETNPQLRRHSQENSQDD